MQKGLFITVEGAEGVGKSTFIERLFEHLNDPKNTQFAAIRHAIQNNPKYLQNDQSDRRFALVKTREPGGTPSAEVMRKLFSQFRSEDPLVVESEFLLVSAARAQHVRKLVKPALDRGDWIICDRFVDSSRVYQGVLGGISTSKVDAVSEFATDGLVPDLTFVLSAPIEVVLARLSNRANQGTEVSRFDAQTRDFHVKLLKAFEELAQKYKTRMVILDSTNSVDQLVKEACQKIYHIVSSNS